MPNNNLPDVVSPYDELETQLDALPVFDLEELTRAHAPQPAYRLYRRRSATGPVGGRTGPVCRPGRHPAGHHRLPALVLRQWA